MKPEWIIYKNEQRIGQALTWHKALDILIEQCKITKLTIYKYSRLISIFTPDHELDNFKIVKEQ